MTMKWTDADDDMVRDEVDSLRSARAVIWSLVFAVGTYALIAGAIYLVTKAVN
jgi:hypothetical protein